MVVMRLDEALAELTNGVPAFSKEERRRFSDAIGVVQEWAFIGNDVAQAVYLKTASNLPCYGRC